MIAISRLFAIAVFGLAAFRTEIPGQQTDPNSARETPSKPSLTASLPSVFEQLFTHYRFENDGTGSREVIAKIRILTEMGTKQHAEETFEYHPLSQELRILYVRIRNKDGILVSVETNVVQRAQAGVTPESDLDERRIRIPGLSIGDEVEYDVVTQIYRPLGPGVFCVQHNFQPTEVLDEQLEVDVPAEREVKLKSRPELKFWKRIEKSWKVYHWENQSPTATQIMAIPSIPGRTPDVQVSSFLSWEEVGRWYSNLEKNHRVPTTEIRVKADELTKGSKSDLERVAALYNFAAKRIGYLSLVSFGIGGSEPRSAPETLLDGYGDCKDKTALLEALLEAEDMHASSVLISADRELDLDIPSPWPFDHVIAMLQIGKDEIWMDPSSAVLRFQTLPYTLRGKQGLVMPSGGVPHLEKTPADAPVPSIWSEEIQGKVNEQGILDATITITAHGDAEIPLRQALLSPTGSMRPRGVDSAVMWIARIDKVTDVHMSDPTITNEPFILSFHLSKPMFIPLLEHNSTITLPFSDCRLHAVGSNAAPAWDNAGPRLIRLGPPGERTCKIKIEFVPKFAPALPKPIALESDYALYKTNYDLQGNILIATQSLTTYRDELRPAPVNGYEAFLRQMLESSGIAITVADSIPEKQK